MAAVATWRLVAPGPGGCRERVGGGDQAIACGERGSGERWPCEASSDVTRVARRGLTGEQSSHHLGERDLSSSTVVMPSAPQRASAVDDRHGEADRLGAVVLHLHLVAAVDGQVDR